MNTFDFAIVGAGIAGASLAAELSATGATVLLLEAEDRPGYHSTGRSAAFWEECYGGPDIVPLTLASGRYLREGGFLTQRGALYIGRASDTHAIDRFEQRFDGTGVTIEQLDRDALEQRLPGLRPDWTRAIWEPACADIDVGALHQHYLAMAKRGGVQLVCRARIVDASRRDGQWTLTSAAGESWTAGALINAAGAWADEFAQLAGARPVGIQPLRRTVVQLRVAPQVPPDLPLVLDIGGGFYFKPESGRVWLSPHDEEPSEPCDAAPEELAVAQAIDRFESVVDWQVEAVERKWAGLRSFAPDRRPVYGWDPYVEGFGWFAGQGGFGIQTSPAAARLAAQLFTGASGDDLTAAVDPSPYVASRFG
ncbi:FAD-dependent oxidoreductase [Qipengyuania sp. XHP0211]|uniref:NAD(P)/FAD-dependent oxidoreductase n=1 Tax=Qipengyuania sp. XHP0211 TaxID=3038079 RepID=UPI00241D2BD8|nr:FAD-dependent oxidoreductase [Qipengyuania sp. XHP0211]MDG5749998.1 FAD-dependent oxidoreductase [Qipengyuania sp. XHP0211]